MKVEEKKIQSFSNKNEGSASYNCNDEYDLSIVCINNNDNILNQYLIPSVQKQLNVKYELLILDSCKNLYSGAREAFNGVLSDLKGQYVVFVHNDFCFEGSDAFQTILHYCKSLESFGVVWVAGCSFDAKKTILTRIKQGANKRSVGQLMISKFRL